MSDLAAKRERLLDRIRSYESCAVAFSAGVDSTVVAKAAQLALGDRAVAVTGVSPSFAAGELDKAKKLAALIGIRHEIISTEEFGSPQFVRNAPDRCYHCKSDLYVRMKKLLGSLGVKVLVNGANADDGADYRPGHRAAHEHDVRSPLAECGITKAELRELAAQWKLPVWDKPAMPCLSSRVAYGEDVTPERMQMIDAAERFLRERGFSNLRVRYHRGDMARLEVPAEELPRLAEDVLRAEVVEHFKSLGFKFVTLDMQGFRSGSLNDLLPSETLKLL